MREIKFYTSCLCPKTAKPKKTSSRISSTSVSSTPPSPRITGSSTKCERLSREKRKIIYSQPSKHVVDWKMTFNLRRHVLRKSKYQTYLKCRVASCPLAYITFNTMKDLNTHHKLYHPNITYKCKNCGTRVTTPSSWKYHKYCQKPKLVACDICSKKFTYISRMRQH